MKIGIIGSGSVGSSLAILLNENGGHDVLVGSRSSKEVSPLEAMAHGEVIILAIHYHVLKDFITPEIQEALANKIVVDATNPLNSDWSPLLLGEDSSAGEEVAKLLPKCKVVKAFNTIFADMMKKDILNKSKNIAAFVASDDEEAMKTVASLAESCGFQSVTINKLSAARYLEAMAHLNIELAVGQGGGTSAYFGYNREGE